MLILIMGVAGSGKTLIGSMLADSLRCVFADGDSFHPAANIDKMSQGVPLTDADREPWLRTIRRQLDQWSAAGQCAVMTCSALKQRYRDYLAGGLDLKIVYLKGSYDLIHERLAARQRHFMQPEMLASQFADLEQPTDAIVIDISERPEQIVNEISEKLAAKGKGLEPTRDPSQSPDDQIT